jgi:hypothetical protein
MDAGHKSPRLYPAYTTKELKASLLTKGLEESTRAKMQGEVDRREVGISVHFSVPQVAGGRPVPIIGRM